MNKKSGDLTLWLEVFTKALAVELNKIKERVRNLSIDFRWRDRLGRQIALSERQIKLIEFIAEKEKLILSEAREVMPDASNDTIWRDIRDLIKKGILKKHGSTKMAYYVMRK